MLDIDMCGEKDDSLFPWFEQSCNKFNGSVIFCSYYIVSLFLLGGVFYEFWSNAKWCLSKQALWCGLFLFYTLGFSKQFFWITAAELS